MFAYLPSVSAQGLGRRVVVLLLVAPFVVVLLVLHHPKSHLVSIYYHSIHGTGGHSF